MVFKKSEIHRIDCFLIGEPYIDGLTKQDNRTTYYDCKLPFSFEYNQPWIVSHACSNCRCIIKLQDYPKKTFVLIDKMFSKYYSESFLNIVSNLFVGTKIFKSPESDRYFITNKNYNDEIKGDLYIPQIKLMSYSCLFCEAEFLCRFKQGHPAERERYDLVARTGKMFFDEIVEIYVENHTSFLNASAENRVII
jgi:hypothetical protein